VRDRVVQLAGDPGPLLHDGLAGGDVSLAFGQPGAAVAVADDAADEEHYNHGSDSESDRRTTPAARIGVSSHREQVGQPDEGRTRREPPLLLAAIVAAAIAVTGGTAASASPGDHGVVSGTEYVQVMSTSTASGPAGAIAYGAFTAAGEAYLGDARLGRIVFPGGTIVLGHKGGKSTSVMNKMFNSIP
jgi:hypothetical protein